MKFSNQLKTATALAVICAAVSVVAADKTLTNPYLAKLSHATAIELPNQSAQLVAKAEGKARSQVTVDVVKTALGLNPAAAGPVVGCIAQAVPEMAPSAAGTAVSLVPAQAETIARVAAAAAPKQAGAIVEAICRVLPKQYKAVALAVAEAAASHDKQILAGIAIAIPALKAPIDKALAEAGETLTVATVLEAIPATLDLSPAPLVPTSGSGTALAGPTYGAPYVPLPGTPVNLDPGAGGDVPTGGRNYAAP